MKDILKSLRIFTARYTIKNIIMVFGVFFVCYAVVALLGTGIMIMEKEDPESFFSGFGSGFMVGITVLIPAAGVGLLSAIYSYNMPITPGYKYFHSLHNSDEHFRRAVIGGNIFALLIGALGTVLNAVMHIFIPDMYNIIVSPVICLLGVGLINFSGYIKNNTARIFAIMPMFLCVGFLAGFTSSAEKDGDTIPEAVYIIAIIAAAAIYIAGLTFSLLKCRKFWRADK